MTEDQFKQLLEQSNDLLFERMEKRLDTRLLERLEQNNAPLFGQVSQYFDTQIGALRDELKSDTGRIYHAVDGIAKRLETDEQERAAINEEQERQNRWIGQLAKATRTKLVPEQ